MMNEKEIIKKAKQNQQQNSGMMYMMKATMLLCLKKHF